MWLLSIALSVGLGLGQVAEAGSLSENNPKTLIAVLGGCSGETGQEGTAGSGCHPSVGCVGPLVLFGPVAAWSEPLVSIRHPDLAQSQRRFGGPTVSLPPPRNPLV
ncbi:hypothetical protein [Tabrizicola sp.]|jgi:hypothetical protein|uniref:hypothetical protein n=1 Tax=Tabrizicola sp. TaxID=2005166 RepID=UPI0025F5CEB1|nr:hypothetical protein [Tabrizicola sp.]MBY0349535.1 hypothetical protein [Tabrizicola sp.]MDK2774288.1 hypothetical protein [Tabrizicola sp.]